MEGGGNRCDWAPGSSSHLHWGAGQMSGPDSRTSNCWETRMKRGVPEHAPISISVGAETCQNWERGLGEWLWGAQPGMLGFLSSTNRNRDRMARRDQWRADCDLYVLRQRLGYDHCCSLRRVTKNHQGKPAENKSPEKLVLTVPIPPPTGDGPTLPKQGCLSIRVAGPSNRRQPEKNKKPTSLRSL